MLDTYVIEEISIYNQSTRSDIKLIKKKLGKFLGNRLYDLDLRMIKNSIESLDWVKVAQVQFVRPNILQVKFEEYDPIFLFNKKYYVDINGDAFTVSDKNINLLNLSSIQTPHNVMYELYKSVKLILDSVNQNILSINKDGEMLIILLDRMRIIVRYSNYEKKLIEFISVYPELTQSYNTENYIKVDMR